MICPLMSKQIAEVRDSVFTSTILYPAEFIPAECQGENCAWWLVAQKMCAITSVALDMDRIGRDGLRVHNFGP